MTESKKIARAKIEAVKKEFEEMKKHRDPLSENEKMPPICGMQIDKNKMRELEVLNSKEAVVSNLDTPIPAKDYDKREKAENKKKEKGTSRE